MSYSPTLQSTLKSALQPPLRAANRSHFLIIGAGNELQGDHAAGLRIADRVADWRLPSVKAISTLRLTAKLVNDIATTRYVIFVDACSNQNQARTVQICPLVLGASSSYPSPQSLLKENCRESNSERPLALLSLAEKLYDYSPQAWLLRVPTESFELEGALSKTAERGCDRALTTIAQFLKTYQQPAEIGRPLSAQDHHQKENSQTDHQRKEPQRKEASSKALALVPLKVA